MLYLCAGIIGYMLGAFTVLMIVRHRNTQIAISTNDNAVQTQVMNFDGSPKKGKNDTTDQSKSKNHQR